MKTGQQLEASTCLPPAATEPQAAATLPTAPCLGAFFLALQRDSHCDVNTRSPFPTFSSGHSGKPPQAE